MSNDATLWWRPNNIAWRDGAEDYSALYQHRAKTIHLRPDQLGQDHPVVALARRSLDTKTTILSHRRGEVEIACGHALHGPLHRGDVIVSVRAVRDGASYRVDVQHYTIEAVRRLVNGGWLHVE